MKKLTIFVGIAFLSLFLSSCNIVKKNSATQEVLTTSDASTAQKKVFPKDHNDIYSKFIGETEKNLSLFKGPYPILQSVSGDTQASFVLQYSEEREPQVTAEDENGNIIKPVSVKFYVNPAFKEEKNPAKIYHIHFKNLVADQAYQLKVKGQFEDVRFFQVPDLKKKKARIGVLSCMDDRWDKEEQLKQWSSLQKEGADYLFFIGDNVYADKNIGIGPSKKVALPSDLWKRYFEARETSAFFRAKVLTPVVALWDDHDYGYNNGDGTYAHKKESKEVFETYFFLSATRFFKRGPGVSSVLKAFGQNFIFIDARSFRTPLGEKPESRFGFNGKYFLNKYITKSSQNWLIQGDQFFGGYHTFESYESGHPKDFKKFISNLNEYKIPFMFLSGDRHLSEVMKVETELLSKSSYEITSSGFHAKTFPDSFKRSPNPRQLAGVSGEINYVIIDIDVTSKHTDLIIRGDSYKEGELFIKTLKLTH